MLANKTENTVSPGSRLLAFVRLARPHQYTKNLFVLLPAFFGGRLGDTASYLPVLTVFCVFCLLASASYALNDVRDREEDRAHPSKRTRPVASGIISPASALAFSGLLALSGAGLSLSLGDWRIPALAGIYLVLNLTYSLFLKHRALVDVSCIALGFVLRILAGSLVLALSLSHWLILMTYLLAMFLALGKRWDDLCIQTDEDDCAVRRSLDGYSPEFVSTAMVVMASVNLVAYIMYTTSEEVIGRYGTNTVFMTSFWVITGILRYLQLTFVEQASGSPTKVLLKDRFIQVVVLAWAIHFSILLYLL